MLNSNSLEAEFEGFARRIQGELCVNSNGLQDA